MFCHWVRNHDNTEACCDPHTGLALLDDTILYCTRRLLGSNLSVQELLALNRFGTTTAPSMFVV